ncbi:MAG: lamin tail domain-containing protein [Pseudomonadota bacterium]
MRASLLLAMALAGCAPPTDLSPVMPGGATGPPPAGPGGATLIEPAAGSSEVPLNLAGVVVRFPGAVSWGGAGLVLCDGAQAVPTGPPVEAPCGDGAAGACYRVALEGALPPGVSCAVALAPGSVDGAGTPVASGVIGTFDDAAAPDTTPPSLGDVAVRVAGPCLEVTFTTDETAAATLTVAAGGVQIDTPAGAGQTRFDVGIPMGALPPLAGATLSVNAVDLAGNQAASAPFAFMTPPAVPPLAITEVLANPAGPEPQQEYVELRNLGDADVSLAGLRLVDSKGGDDLPPETLAAGAYALVVTATYDPAAGPDPPPRPGTLLVRVDTRLGSDGLSNSGEPVQLLQGEAVVSSYGGWVSVSAGSWNGKAVHRLVQSACDAAAAWNHTPLPPTPGSGPP